jgi:(2Fe-2S) ferredoxin
VEAVRPPFKKYLFVCENSRPEGDCCSEAGANVREKLKSAVKAAGLASKLRVSRTGCLDSCMQGPNVLLMPDNVWFRRVGENDIPAILKTASEGL